MGWSEWKNFTNYGKCIFISASWKKAQGQNTALISKDNTSFIDNEYLTVSENHIIVNKPFKAKVYLITRTGSDTAVNTYTTLKNNGIEKVSTNDGKKAIGKSAFSEVYFEAGDIINGVQSANGTVTTHTVMIFV